jgi:mono/diheme cytochrome c family protein
MTDAHLTVAHGVKRVWLLAVMLAIFSLGCSGADTKLAASGNDLAQFQSALPALPTDGPGARHAATLQAVIQNGDAAAVKSAGALVTAPNLRLPAGAGQLEWAYYSFNIGAGTLVDVLPSFQMETGTQVWVGLSNYTKNRWDISGPYATGAAVAATAGMDYTSAGGNFHCLIATYNINTALVQSVRLRYDDGVNRYHIAGTVLTDAALPIDGAFVTLTPGDVVAMCNASGAYSVGNLVPGAYDVTPSAAGYTFNPASLTVPLINADVDNADFVGTQGGVTYSINGKLTDGASAAIPASSVTVDPGGMSFSCDGQGVYHATGLAAGAYKVTPVAAGYTFIPAFTNIDIVAADVNNINFSGNKPVTYVDDARPFLMANCAGCHKADKSLLAGFTVESYDSSLTMLALIKSQVQGDHNGSYSAADKALIAAWVDAGGPLGATATHYTDVKAQLFSTNCMGCHSSTLTGGARNGAPTDVNWDTFAAATGWRTNNKQVSKRGNVRVQAGTMPPGGGLSAAQQQLMQKWIDSGWPN